MKLYYSPGACSLAPHIVAREAELPVDIERVDLGSGKTETGISYREEINPKGYVPALKLDSGDTLTEVANVVAYLADQGPAKNLAPAAGTMERYRLQEWLTFISSEIHKGFSPLFNPKLPAGMAEILKDKLATRFAYLDAHFAKNKFLLGDRFSAADAYLFTVTNWTVPLKIDLSPYPNLVAYRARVAERPAVRAAMEAEGLMKKAA